MAVSSVSSTTTSTTLLAASTRRVATIQNTDANTLYVLLDSGTASATNHTAALGAGDYYEIPGAYTGQITGVWSADGSGAALVTEF